MHHLLATISFIYSYILKLTLRCNLNQVREKPLQSQQQCSIELFSSSCSSQNPSRDLAETCWCRCFWSTISSLLLSKVAAAVKSSDFSLQKIHVDVTKQSSGEGVDWQQDPRLYDGSHPDTEQRWRWNSFWLSHLWAHRACTRVSLIPSCLFESHDLFSQSKHFWGTPLIKTSGTNHNQLHSETRENVWHGDVTLEIKYFLFFFSCLYHFSKELQDQKWKIYNKQSFYDSYFRSQLPVSSFVDMFSTVVHFPFWAYRIFLMLQFLE